MSRIYFCSFASSEIKGSLHRIGVQAKSFRLFDKIFLYTEKELPDYGRIRCEKIIEKTGTRRGYAYWCWKPIILLDIFDKINEGDIVFYSDAGSHLNKRCKNKLIEYIQQAEKNDIWAIGLSEGTTDRVWCKKDTLKYFTSLIDSEIDFKKYNIDTAQIEAGTIIIKKSTYTINLLNQWNQLMDVSNIHLFDDSVSVEKESAEFRQHRHDQSVFSLLLKLPSNHYVTSPVEDFWAADRDGWDKLKKTSPILRLRDKSNISSPLLYDIKEYILKSRIFCGRVLRNSKKMFLYARNKQRGMAAYNFDNWFNVDDQWKSSFLISKYLPADRKWYSQDIKPTLTYFSVFGDRKVITNSKAKYKVFFTGEDTEVRYTEYKNNAVDIADVSIGFLPKEIMIDRYGADQSKNYIRYPLWLLYYFGTLTDKDKIAKAVEQFNTQRYHKTKFAALVASHDDFGIRQKLYDLCTQIAPVSCGGKFLHNDDELMTKYNDNKIKYLSQFMFNICPENVSTPGYTTEKIFQSLDSGCIPVYYGGAGTPIEKDVLNDKFILKLDDKGLNSSDILEQIRLLYSDELYYKSFVEQPKLLDSSVDWIYNKNIELKDILGNIIK